MNDLFSGLLLRHGTTQRGGVLTERILSKETYATGGKPMDLYQIRDRLKTQTIYDLPLRVTFYARVSTDSDEQINSLGNQERYYEEFIRSKKNWTYVPGYIDEGKSGTSTRKRERFNDMVRDGKLGMFDLILTKEVSLL